MSLFQNFNCGPYSDALEKFAAHWGISNPEDQARFIGQLAVESQNFSRVVENLNYRPGRLLDLFYGRNGLQTLEQATAICAQGIQRIAEAIYGVPWGAKLGNTSVEDGWLFIGRGLIMLTGRQNYHDASFGCFGDDRLLQNPSLLQQTEIAANVACWFWYNRKLSALTDVRAITLKVNGGTTALDERVAATRRALSLLPQGN